MRTPGTKTLLSAVVTLSLLAPLIVATPAPAQTTCTSPPTVFPEASITPGMTGTGLTAISGSTPTSFDIQVLGTLHDAVLPGFDLVIFQITGPDEFLSAAHGVAAGMSGSPIYLSGMLAGAVSYRFYFSDPTIGLFTPAQQMVDLLNYVGGPAAVKMPAAVPVDATARRVVARAAGVSVTDVPSEAVQVTTPLAVTGLTEKRRQQLQDILDKHGLPISVYRAGATTSAAAADPTTLEPGEPFSAVLSTGDVTFAGIGTTTFACGDLDVAWGHPFFFEGETEFGMANANVVAVINDPSGILGPFKVLEPTELHGTVIQDRAAGIVGQAGTPPAGIAVTSSFTNTDDGRSRDGQTDIIYQEGYWGPEITFEHMFQNLLLVFDRFGDGTLSMSWNINGVTEDGQTFTVRNRNMSYSEYFAFVAAYKLLSEMYALAFNKFEKVTFTGVDATGDITENNLNAKFTRIRASSSLQPRLASRGVLKAKAGSKITIEVTLEPVEGDTQVATVRLRVPRGARGYQTVSLSGGSRRYWFSSRGIGSFDELLDKLNGGTHPNDLIVRGFGQQVLQEQDVVVRDKAAFTVKVV